MQNKKDSRISLVRGYLEKFSPFYRVFSRGVCAGDPAGFQATLFVTLLLGLTVGLRKLCKKSKKSSGLKRT